MNTEILPPARPQRLYSLDALRGFDMLWIMGLGETIGAFAKGTHIPFWVAFSDQFEHPIWNGFAFWDLIFPLFMFMAGGFPPFFFCRGWGKRGRKRGVFLQGVKKGGFLFLLLVVFFYCVDFCPLFYFQFLLRLLLIEWC